MTVTGALVLGAAGSLHCFAMCGPLACAAIRRGPRTAPAIAYHSARVGAYALVGALLGAAGGTVPLALQRGLPWLMISLLVLTVIDPQGRWLRRLPPLPGIAQIVRSARSVHERISPIWRAALTGALTPLLPCGLLYGIGAAAVASSSALSGALLMGGFALGALPSLAAAQLSSSGLHRLSARRAIQPAQIERALALVAACVLVYRALTLATHHGCH